MIEEPPSLPVFIVTGANFTIEVRLDEYNAGFDLMHQQYEAATRAIETLKNAREDDSCRIVMNPDSKDEKPKAGATVLVHAKDSDPDKALAIPTYICFANFGAYEEAEKHKLVFEKIFSAHLKELESNEKKLQQEAAVLDSMAERPKKSAKKKKK